MGARNVAFYFIYMIGRSIGCAIRTNDGGDYDGHGNDLIDTNFHTHYAMVRHVIPVYC